MSFIVFMLLFTIVCGRLDSRIRRQADRRQPDN